jgi:DNA polymerase-3 subunit delta
VIDFNEEDLNSLKIAAESSPMFKEKKLLVLENSFAKKAEWQKELSSYLKKGGIVKNEEVALVFYEKQLPDRRTELFKFLAAKQNVSQEFKKIEGVKLENWIKKVAERNNVEIEPLAVQRLELYVGSNLWQMANEMNKLTVFCGKEKIIKEKDVEELVAVKTEINIFDTVDALSARDKKKVFKLLHRHLEEGENEIYLLSMFIRQFRNLLIIKDLEEKGISHYEMPKRTGLHPFVVRKTFSQTKNFSLEGLKKIYARLLELDLSIKTGKISALSALDTLVMSI